MGGPPGLQLVRTVFPFTVMYSTSSASSSKSVCRTFNVKLAARSTRSNENSNVVVAVFKIQNERTQEQCSRNYNRDQIIVSIHCLGLFERYFYRQHN